MHSLAEAEGSVATASVRREVQVDRKINFLVKELCRFNMRITGISETKWFGQGVYEVDGFVMVHSGRPVPTGDDPALRNEGVGIVMSSTVATAWRSSGECWRAISSRIVYAQLKLEHRGGRRMSRDTYLSVVSAYAPTYNSPQKQKDVFMMICVVPSIQ